MSRRRFVIGILIGVPIGILIYKLIRQRKIMGNATNGKVTEVPSFKSKPEAKPEQSIVLSSAVESDEPVTPDDLKKINGIGPKISDLLNKAGIFTFQQLADVKLETLEAILEEAGPRFQLADPDDWAKQARELAH